MKRIFALIALLPLTSVAFADDEKEDKEDLANIIRDSN